MQGMISLFTSRFSSGSIFLEYIEYFNVTSVTTNPGFLSGTIQLNFAKYV